MDAQFTEKDEIANTCIFLALEDKLFCNVETKNTK